MAIKGNLKEASLADVLQLLALGRKSGCLSVSDRNSFGRIYFDTGWITHASLVNRRDRMGDLLIKNGVVSPEALAAAVSEQTGQNPPRLGEILVARGDLSRSQLEQFIRVQVEEAVYFLFTWTQGSFYFEPGEVPEASETLVRINPEGLLLEGARRVDEWALIEKKIPSLDLIFSLDLSHGDPSGAELGTDQKRILPLIDGQRSVRDIVEASGLLEFDAAKALFGLIQAGYARQRGRKREASQPAVRPSRLQEHYNLGIAFYRTSMYEEAEREFLRIVDLEESHADARFYLALIAQRQGRTRPAIRRWMELIERGGRRAPAFQNLALALETAGRVEDALLATDEGLRHFAEDRALRLTRAILLTRLGRFEEAVGDFDRYRAAPGAIGAPPAAYFSFSLVALGGIGRLAEARSRADEGVELHPRCAALLVNAAVVCDRAGASEDAEALFRRAAEESPDLAQAQRGLADALYRRGAYDEAGELFARIVETDGDPSGDLHFRLGNIAYKRGDREAAVKYWRQTVELDPQHTVARTNLELVEGVLAGSRG